MSERMLGTAVSLDCLLTCTYPNSAAQAIKAQKNAEKEQLKEVQRRMTLSKKALKNASTRRSKVCARHALLASCHKSSPLSPQHALPHLAFPGCSVFTR